MGVATNREQIVLAWLCHMIFETFQKSFLIKKIQPSQVQVKLVQIPVEFYLPQYAILQLSAR